MIFAKKCHLFCRSLASELHGDGDRATRFLGQVRQGVAPAELGAADLLQRRFPDAAAVLLRSGGGVFRGRSNLGHGYDQKAAGGAGCFQ